MALGIVSGLPVLLARVRTEQANRNVELVASYTDFAALANSQGVAPARFFAALHRAGVQGIGVPEDSIGSLEGSGRLRVVSGTSWLADVEAVGAAPPPFPLKPTSSYVITSDRALASWLVNSLAYIPGGAGTRRYTLHGRQVVAVPLAPANLVGVPLGFAPGAFRLARSLGMDAVPRPESLPSAALDASAVRALFHSIADSRVSVHSIVFAGASTTPIPGYPAAAATTLAAMRRGGYNLGVIETPNQLTNVDQPGTRQLNDALGQRTVRVYSVPPWLLVDYSPSAAALSVENSVVERNLHLVYLHPLLVGTHLIRRNVQLWGSVARDLVSRGYRLAPPQPFASVSVPAPQRALQGLGAVAAGLLWLDLLFGLTRRWRWRLLVVLGGLALLVAGATHTTGIVLGSLGTALTFGGLATLVVAHLWKRLEARPPGGLAAVWVRGVVTALAVFGVALAGGLALASLMGSTSYILDWSYFRGVKLVYLGIPCLSAVALVRIAGLSGSPSPDISGDAGPDGGRPGRGWAFVRREVLWLGRQSVTYMHVLAFLVVGAIGGYYLLRSGNVNVTSVPAVEQHLRELFMRLFVYRPREKEFLVGYPALLIAAWCAARRWRWAFGFFAFGASVAQVSVIDTFEHSRTPFLHSLLREVFGLGVGLATGTVALLVVAAVVTAVLRRRGPRDPAVAGGDPQGAVEP